MRLQEIIHGEEEEISIAYIMHKRKGIWWLTQQLPSDTYGFISNPIYFLLQLQSTVAVDDPQRQTTAGSTRML